MKGKILLSLLISLTMASFSLAQVPADQDTVFITASANGGDMETAINSDVDGSGNRINPNRVYALYEGQVYYQVAPLDVNNPNGTLTIVGVPDPNNPTAKTKPMIIIVPTAGQPVLINGGGTNQVYGSIKMVNIYYQTQQLDGTQNNELFYCGTGAEKQKQTLTIDNCVFEFSNIDLFDCTDESGAIGGWPKGASFFITNSYFRNLFFNGQWWGSRIFQCKHPIDTLWVENNTITTGGLTFLQQNQIADFVYINHNTIINNKKYWLLSPYRHEMYITNNIFVNQNWVGEDTNVTNSGQDPDKIYMSTINIDTNNTTNGLIVQEKYYVNGDSSQISSDLDFSNMKIFVSNNVNYDSPELISGYYQSPTYINDTVGTPPSYLNWAGAGNGPWALGNTPGEWMNSRTQALFDQYKPPNGMFVEQNTLTEKPQTTTSMDLSADEVTAMAEWNQNQYGDKRFSTATVDILDPSVGYIYGDYDPQTVPGIDNGTKTEVSPTGGAGIQVGVTKFSDFAENFKQTAQVSTIDQLPIGSLIWDDAQNAAYNPADAMTKVYAAFNAAVDVEETGSGLPLIYKLSQNYPNPFNPTTTIDFALPKAQNVTLKVYNILGQEVATLINSNIAAGNHSIRFDASNLSSGLYIYKISAGSFTSAKKMMLLK
ncbi:MAG: T9SS type A sorting domain-containing protein [Ignavibacteriaceae bacterium]